MNNSSAREYEETENLRRINRHVTAVLFLAAMPSIGLMTIGFCWNMMSQPVATTSVISLIIMTIGSIVATSIRLDW